MAPPNSTPLYSWPFLCMALGNFSSSASFSVFFLFPLIIEDYGGSEADIGLIMGIFVLASTLSRPWISDMVDRIGRKRSFTVGSLLMTLLPFFYPAGDLELSIIYLPLLALRIVHGIGLALCFTAAFTYVADIVPATRLNEGIGMFGISGLVGIAVGPLLAEAALNRYGASGFFLSASALAVVGLICHLPLRETLPQGLEAGRMTFFAVLRQPRMLLVTALAVLFGFGLTGSGNFVAPLAEHRHISFASLFFISYSASAVTIRLFGGRLADRVGEHRVVPYGFAIAGVGLFVLVLVTNPVLLALAGLAAGAGHGLLFPTLNSWAVRSQPPALRGKVTGIYTGALDGGNFAGSVLLGFIGEWAGLSVLFLCAGAALWAGLLVLKVSRRV
ncbi:MAG: MFS transporter [Syntrophotaleaceae bacterium]